MVIKSASMIFDNTFHLSQLLGDRDVFLLKIENKLSVSISCRGEIININGEESAVVKTKTILENLYQRIKEGYNIEMSDVDAAIRMIEHAPANVTVKNDDKTIVNKNGISKDISFKTLKKPIVPYTEKQKNYMQSLMDKEMVFATGPAGTGKTYLAVAAAVTLFAEDKVDRIILSRPAVEAGESLGFLPGDMREKVDPYLRPLYDALNDMMPAEKVLKYMQTSQIEIAPLAFMRGRTLRNAAIILDESQNSTPVQMKMFLTRIGDGSKMFITGDLSQTDLPKGQRSGLRDAIEKLSDIDEIDLLNFTEEDSVRHELTTKIINAYGKYDNDKKWNRKEANGFKNEY